MKYGNYPVNNGRTYASYTLVYTQEYAPSVSRANNVIF